MCWDYLADLETEIEPMDVKGADQLLDGCFLVENIDGLLSSY